MKSLMAICIGVAATGTTAFMCMDPGGGQHDTMMEIFDTDQNDEISTEEMEAATAVLMKMDANDDGALTRNELPRPPKPRRDRRREDRPRRPTEEQQPESVEPGTVLFHGGHETDRRDGGRPVALIAAALGVESQVFRDAFSGVQPSRSGPPSAGRARANKEVLMAALGPHGVTNDRLDEVSNYYRYRPQDDELWRVRPAKARAIVTDGLVTGIEIVEAGSGYSSEPEVRIVGHPDVKVTAQIAFDTDMSQNGRVTELTLSE